jgi:hypothetical protein
MLYRIIDHYNELIIQQINEPIYEDYYDDNDNDNDDDNNDNIKEVNECFICYEVKKDDEKNPIKLKDQTIFIKICSCDGWVHNSCLYMWFELNEKCPICRDKMLKNYNLYIFFVLDMFEISILYYYSIFKNIINKIIYFIVILRNFIIFYVFLTNVFYIFHICLINFNKYDSYYIEYYDICYEPYHNLLY